MNHYLKEKLELNLEESNRDYDAKAQISPFIKKQLLKETSEGKNTRLKKQSDFEDPNKLS